MLSTPETLFEWALAVAGGSTLIVFAVALQNFFVQPPVLTRWQRLFEDISVVVGVMHGISLVILKPASEAWAGIGVAVYCVSLALFLSAIEAARRVRMTHAFVFEPRCTHILDTGPYRFIRHPIYLSYSIAWLAAPVAMHSIVLGVSAVGMITCYILSAIEEERRMLSGPQAEPYRAYQGSTKRMVPFVF